MIKFQYTTAQAVYLLISIVSSVIFLQQVFVINIGGSFKIYEIIALLLCVIFICYDKPKIYGKLSVILFCLLIITPIISFIFLMLDSTKYDYYSRFPDAVNSLRTNVVFAPLILLIYYCFCWVFFNYATASETIYANKNKLIKTFVVTATIVSIYNFYSYITVYWLGLPDIIPGFLDYRNSPVQLTGRFCGFSSESGTYVILQTWVVYYLWFYDALSFKHKKLIQYINLSSLLMTMSSLLIPSLLIFFIQLFRKSSFTRKIRLIVVIITIIIVGGTVLSRYNLDKMVRYILVEKVQNYLSPSDNTLDSGAYRNFTSRLGLKVFQDNMIIGCGGGASCFYLWKYEYKMGIVNWGERITATTYPQNAYAKVLAELGLCGFMLLAAFYLLFLYYCFRYRKQSQLLGISLYGGIFMLFALSTTYPITSLFLWYNIALASNTIYHLRMNSNVLRIQTNQGT